MKISIKIDPETMFLIHDLIKSKIFGFRATDRQTRFSQSILFEIYESLTNKCFNYSNNANGKARKLTLRFHQAVELYNLLLERKQLGIYEANKIEILKNDLHQKLL